MQEAGNKNNLMKYMANPRCFTLKRWFSELLKEKYSQHDTIVERISSALATDKDVEDFGKLIMEVYYSAYMKAVNEYKSQAEKLGFKIVMGTTEIN